MADTIPFSDPSGRREPIRWLWTNTFILVGTAIFYVIIHVVPAVKSKYGWENVKLDKERIQTLNAIFLTPVIGKTATTTPPTSMTAPSGPAMPDNSFLPPTDATLLVAQKYIKNELGKVDSAQLNDITFLLGRLPAQACISYLLSQKFKVESYFWLVGGQAYWEVIFWCIFGVLASCLFIVSSSLRKHSDSKDEVFDVADIPYQAVKLLYAPLCVLILVFAYSLISGDALTDIEAGKGTLIFAFITGFYSGRMMTLLNRLKEVILPGDDLTGKSATGKGTGLRARAVADDLVVTVILDPAKLDKAVLADIQATELDNAIIELKDSTGTLVATLENLKSDQEARFVAHHIQPGAYRLVGTLVTEDGFNFTSEEDLVVDITPDSRKATLTLHLNEAVG